MFLDHQRNVIKAKIAGLQGNAINKPSPRPVTPNPSKNTAPSQGCGSCRRKKGPRQ